MTEKSEKPLSKKRIAEIRKRLGEASPGPWAVEYDPDIEGVALEHFVVNDTSRLGALYEPADVAFVAHAHADIADLLADNDRLRNEARLHIHQMSGLLSLLTEAQLECIEQRQAKTALLEIVRWVATTLPWATATAQSFCFYCDEASDGHHDGDCLWLHANEVVARLDEKEKE